MPVNGLKSSQRPASSSAVAGYTIGVTYSHASRIACTMNFTSRKYTYRAPSTRPTEAVNVHSSSVAGTTSRKRNDSETPSTGSATTRMTVEMASVNRFAAGETSGRIARGKNTLSVIPDASTIDVVDDAMEAE